MRASSRSKHLLLRRDDASKLIGRLNREHRVFRENSPDFRTECIVAAQNRNEPSKSQAKFYIKISFRPGNRKFIAFHKSFVNGMNDNRDICLVNFELNCERGPVTLFR